MRIAGSVTTASCSSTLEINHIEKPFDRITGRLYSTSFDGCLKEWNSKERFAEEAKTVYVKLYLKNFRGDKHAFLQLSQTELIESLQDKQKLATYFNEDICIRYEKDRDFEKINFEFGGLGVTPEKIENDFYRYTSSPVKGVSAQQAGTIGFYPMESVKKNDFVILDTDKQLTRVTEQSGLSAKLCDVKGNILSEQIYYPGNALPAPQTVWNSLTNLFQFFKNKQEATTEALVTYINAKLQ